MQIVKMPEKGWRDRYRETAVRLVRKKDLEAASTLSEMRYELVRDCYGLTDEETSRLDTEEFHRLAEAVERKLWR